MKDSYSPLKFWDYYVEQGVLINNLTSKNHFQLNGVNANLKLVVEPGDTSNMCCLGWLSVILLSWPKRIPSPGGKAWLMSWSISQLFKRNVSVDIESHDDLLTLLDPSLKMSIVT